MLTYFMLQIKIGLICGYDPKVYIYIGWTIAPLKPYEMWPWLGISILPFYSSDYFMDWSPYA